MRFLDRFRADLLYAGGAVFVLAFLVLPGDFLPDHDAYFHIRIAEMMAHHGWVSSLPALAETIHADRYVDYHFLFHAAQVPFVWLTPDLVTAAKVSTILFCGFSVFAFSVLLGALAVPSRYFWVCFLLLASPIFAGRLAFGRGITLFLGIFFLFAVMLVQKRRWPAFILGWIAVWTYPGFPAVVLLVVLFQGARWFRGHGFERAGCMGLAGVVSGFLIHPAFPRQFFGYWLELGVHFLRPAGLEIIAEWEPPTPAILTVGLGLVTIVLIAGLTTVRPPSGPFAAALGGLGVLFGAASAVSMKPFETAVPLLSLWLALFEWGKWPRWLRRTAGGILLAIFFFIHLPDTYRRMEMQMQAQDPSRAFEAADWIRNHTSPGNSVLLHWGDFPVFFFRLPDRSYQSGMNPVYAFGRNPDRSLLMRSFFEGAAVNFYVVPGFFHARYAVLNLRYHSRAAELLLTMPDRGKLVFRNAEYVIFDFPEAGKLHGR